MARKSLLKHLELPVKPGQVEATSLLNWDVQPIEKARRTWGWTAFLSMWSTGAFCMSNFQIGSSMLSLGLNWWQVIVLTLVGHILAVSLILVSAWPGFEYGIPFPVATRAAWGHFATPFMVLNRVLLSVI
ncbi:hypothetical protein JDV02_010682 [Purpureocillium takamizusanense]|uniref:Allantoin permease n=1 Tax=Purpureocillium takamizusanense TaxID=2060973 RepID=A0A9Q8QPD0_9HYPO|nr:uncharacterized protein JDV02_010682 [Purpureocillium takamizusanense]UNI24969.1 hypothetical protein JDV02_010682 [Purpureocillium takamizusanense]